jgi:hypothetical protein
VNDCADRRAESRHADDDLPRTDPPDFLEHRCDGDPDDRARDRERRSHHRKDSLDRPAVDPLDPISTAVDLRRRELDRPLLAGLSHRQGRSSSAAAGTTVTTS